MKVLHYINNLGSGGAEKLLSDILPIMKAKGHDVSLLLARSEHNVEKFENEIKKHHINIINLNKGNFNITQILSIIRLLRKENYDIVHAHLFPTQYWLALASFFVPKNTILIKTEHSVYNSRNRKAYLKRLERFIYNRYKAIIAITDIVNVVFTNWLKHAKIVTINNGVNLSEIHAQQANLRNQDYNFINTTKFNILMVGRFDFIAKDQLTLLKGISLLDTDVCLYFAGEGPNLDNVKNEAKALKIDDRCFFLGLRPDVYKLMSLVDLNVLSTRKEGLSGVALESLASGKPFLGSDVEGVNDIVPNSNFLFEAGNEVALAKLISEVKTNSCFRTDLVNQGVAHAKKFDIEIMVDKYLDLYQEVIVKSRKS
ncbi:Glycosyltransferase involved in cell wall bisynthesis [Soonwooa buanensis]|uniref:Glycosyltransferase involved in cell wall bisynthesis n=1 Tax=Soonwooa buanensis TaxID=619805 RepID=A0A1T5FIV3_9FLAO|nr:glycosyltransferase [Soonwooa buanensis]SKB96032.1 Glycosyltransferase involved in cell wall bisynthesis [Soonwooa buanensis]